MKIKKLARDLQIIARIGMDEKAGKDMLINEEQFEMHLLNLQQTEIKIAFKGVSSEQDGWIKIIKDRRASVHGFFVEGMLECLREYEIESLSFVHWEADDFMGFKDYFHNIKSLSLSRIYSKSYSGLEFCVNLKSFTYYEIPLSKSSLNLCLFKSLETIKIVWPKKNNYPKVGFPVEVFQGSLLKSVHVENYKGLFDVFVSPHIEKLTLRFCSFESLEGVSLLSNLKLLHIEGNKELINIDGVQNLTKLNYLVIGNTPKLNRIPDVRKMNWLEHISIGVADETKVVPDPDLMWLDGFKNLSFFAYFYPVAELSWAKIFEYNLSSIVLCSYPKEIPTNAELEKLANAAHKTIDGHIFRVKSNGFLIIKIRWREAALATPPDFLAPNVPRL